MTFERWTWLAATAALVAGAGAAAVVERTLQEPTVLRASASSGWRALVGRLCWLRVYGAWARQDVADTRRWLRATVTADPGQLSYWEHGARILAWDLPAWQGEGPEADAVSTGREWLAEALQLHPQSPDLWIEAGELERVVAGDAAAAAACYARAAALPGAPYFAGRLHVEMLEVLGQDEAAYRAWIALHATLVDASPEPHRGDPMAGIVLQRIRLLEQRRGVAAADTYSPPRRHARLDL